MHIEQIPPQPFQHLLFRPRPYHQKRARDPVFLVDRERRVVDFSGHREESARHVGFGGFEVRGVVGEPGGRGVGGVRQDDEPLLVGDVRGGGEGVVVHCWSGWTAGVWRWGWGRLGEGSVDLGDCVVVDVGVYYAAG